MHLTMMHKAINTFKPKIVIVDPLNSFVIGGNATEVKAMLMRLVDFLKMKQITGLFTNLTAGGGALEQTDIAISSLIDTWLLLRDIEIGGERNRGIYILKSRGMAHSNQIREFLITDHGIELCDVYVGSGECADRLGASGSRSSRASRTDQCTIRKLSGENSIWNASAR
jgi:circadian clock protein KaiC